MSNKSYNHRPKKVKLADLLPNEDILGPDPDPNMLATMHEYGMWHRVILTEYEDKLWLIDGGRRIKAARMLEWKDIDCEIYENVNPFDRAAVSIILNNQRSINPIAEYYYLSQLREEDYESFLKTIKADRSHVEKIMSLDKIDTDLRDDFISAYEDGRIAEGTLFKIAKVSKPRQAYVKKTLDDTGRVTGKDISHAKKADAQAVLSANESIFGDIEIPEVPERSQDLYVLVSDDLTIEGPYFEFRAAYDEQLRREVGWRTYKLVEV